MKRTFLIFIASTLIMATIIIAKAFIDPREACTQSLKDANDVAKVATKVAESSRENVQNESNQVAPEVIFYYTGQDIIDISKVLYNECRGLPSMTEKACVVWTILNRVDEFQMSIADVVRAENQYAFYENTPVLNDLYELAADVLWRWNQEKNGVENVGRVLPTNYLYFTGYDGHNHFRSAFAAPYAIWDYSLPSPYGN